MGKKYYITESQMKKIVTHIRKEDELLEEGTKEVALSLALLAGVSLGSNKAVAQSNLSKSDIRNQIDMVLNDTTKLDKVVDSLELMGYEDAEEKIEGNAEEIKKKLKRPFSKPIKTTAKDYESLVKKLKRGYAITKIQQDTLKQKISNYPDIEPVLDVFEVEFSSDNLFGSGLYDLSPEASDTITDILNQIKNNGGTVLNITVESSTDKEPIDMGNEELAKLRAESVVDVLGSLGIDSTIIDTVLKPEQGPDVFSRRVWDDNDKLIKNPNYISDSDTRRDSTKQFRKVGIKIEAVKLSEEAPQVMPVEDEVDVIVNTFKLVKTKKWSFKLTLPKIRIKLRFTKNKKYKCKTDCPVWQK